MIDLLRSIIISPNPDLAAHLQTALADFGEAVKVCRTIKEYPSIADLTRALRVHAPEAVFLSLENVEKASAVVKLLETEVEGLQVIGIHPAADAAILRETMRIGIRELLTMPFEPSALVESLTRVKDLLDKKPPVYGATEQVFSFFPAKAGAGSTTIAVNTSAALSRRSHTSVLLADFDLNSGMLRFLLKLRNTNSILEALEQAPSMDETIWPQLVTPVGAMDVLHAGGVHPSLRIEPEQVHALIQFMRRNYKVLCFDLSGNLERYSLEVMRESKRIMLVCTSEVSSLHLAKEKLAFLRSIDLHDRVSVLLNRLHRKDVLGVDKVQELLGVPVFRSFSNDYAVVNDAISSAELVDPASSIGKQFDEFAQSLIEQRPQLSASKHKFLELFRVSKPIPVRH